MITQQKSRLLAFNQGWYKTRSVLVNRAMINFDLGPAQCLGTLVMFGSCFLHSVRLGNPKLSKDADVVASSVGVLIGCILVFQGWRLDPLLLFGQILTTGVAVGFALEAFKLRAITYHQEMSSNEFLMNEHLAPVKTEVDDQISSWDSGSRALGRVPPFFEDTCPSFDDVFTGKKGTEEFYEEHLQIENKSLEDSSYLAPKDDHVLQNLPYDRVERSFAGKNINVRLQKPTHHTKIEKELRIRRRIELDDWGC